MGEAGKRHCIFCGQSPVSREHFFADWIINALGGPKKIRRVASDDTVSEFTAPLIVRCVCKQCNNGWMSSLEASAKPMITEFLNDKPISLTPEQQRILALWATKMAMVGEEHKSQGKDRFYTQEQREALYQNSKIPAGTNVQIGRFTGSGLHHVGTEVWWSIKEVPKALHGCITTLVVGHLVVQVTTVRAEIETHITNVEIPMRTGDWDSLLFDILPASTKAVTWPPIRSFNGSAHSADFILNLENRWKLGEKVIL
jgi:hypothetical protein